MAFPIVQLRRPAILDGQPNGRFPASILEEIPGLAGGPAIRLVAPAARAWRAMQAHALRDGVTLKASGPHDSYRPYETQERIFRQRYTTDRLPGRPARTWQGSTWYQRPGTAAAAVPGTSNHGLALAVDTGTELDGDPGTESIDRPTLDWLLRHALSYGWSWELQSEPWHLRYFAGDNPPPAVTAHPSEEDDMPTTDELVDALRPMILDAVQTAVHHVLETEGVSEGVAAIRAQVGDDDAPVPYNLRSTAKKVGIAKPKRIRQA